MSETNYMQDLTIDQALTELRQNGSYQSFLEIARLNLEPLLEEYSKGESAQLEIDSISYHKWSRGFESARSVLNESVIYSNRAAQMAGMLTYIGLQTAYGTQAKPWAFVKKFILGGGWDKELSDLSETLSKSTKKHSRFKPEEPTPDAALEMSGIFRITRRFSRKKLGL